jgi:hypothetical protein
MIDREALTAFLLNTVKAWCRAEVDFAGLAGADREAPWLGGLTADYLESFYDIRPKAPGNGGDDPAI